MTTTAEKVSAADLNQFTGTEEYHKFSILFRRHVLTDGVKHVAEKCGAFWMMDAICSYHPKVMKNQMLQEMQIWKFKKTKGSSGILTCWKDTGPGEKPLITQKIDYTNFFDKFDGDEISFYVIPGETIEDGNLWVILLPSEY